MFQCGYPVLFFMSLQRHWYNVSPKGGRKPSRPSTNLAWTQRKKINSDICCLCYCYCHSCYINHYFNCIYTLCIHVFWHYYLFALIGSNVSLTGVGEHHNMYCELMAAFLVVGTLCEFRNLHFDKVLGGLGNIDSISYRIRILVRNAVFLTWLGSW